MSTRITGATPLMEMCHDLSAQIGRCPDGLTRGLTEVEKRMFNNGTGPEHIGEFISSVLTDHKTDFIRQHVALHPDDREFPTMIIENLSQTMLYSLGLRGRFTELAFPHYYVVNHDEFRSDQVMKRFLLGARDVTHPDADIRVHFDAYTVDKMIDLLQAARERGFTEPNGARRHEPDNPKSVLSNEVITRELVNPDDYEPVDPRMGPSFADFNINGFPDGNDYFLPPRPTDAATDFRLTREFWLYMLRKYNYIVPW